MIDLREEMTKQVLNLFVWALVLSCTSVGASASARTTQRPNFIVFLVDDYDKHQTNIYGGRVLTPNLDRLAREGMTFHSAHVTSTVCTPSRYTFLTGRYAGSSYSPIYRQEFPLGQQASPRFNVALEDDNMNVGAILAQHGYATGFVGKYHVGPVPKNEVDAAELGLHHIPKNMPLTDELNRQKFENEKRHRQLIIQRGFTWAKNIYWGLLRRPFQYHNPEWTIQAAVEFIEEHKDQPFYLHYGTSLLHGTRRQWYNSLTNPPVTGEGIIDRFSSAMPPRFSVIERVIAAGLTADEAGYTWMDDSLGVLLDKLDELKLADNTVVLFIADHGSINKGSLYRSGGTEVPCVVRWPAGIKANTRSDELIQNTDFVPTWFELAGVEPPKAYKVDGVSMAPLFTRPDEPIRQYVYSELGAARSIKTKQFSYIALRYSRDQIAGVRAGDKKTLWQLTGLVSGLDRALDTHPSALSYDQLYDVARDPDARKNLASDPGYKQTLEQMKHFLTAELKRFDNRPYGEFVPGGNATPGRDYNDVLSAVRVAADQRKSARRGMLREK